MKFPKGTHSQFLGNLEKALEPEWGPENHSFGPENPCPDKQCQDCKPSVRTFETGANRDSEEGKPRYFSCFSVQVLEQFAYYMLAKRKMKDGSVRDANNWKHGFPVKETLESLQRHVVDVANQLHGLPGKEHIEDALCGVIFNAQSILFEKLVEKSGNREL